MLVPIHSQIYGVGAPWQHQLCTEIRCPLVVSGSLFSLLVSWDVINIISTIYLVAVTMTTYLPVVYGNRDSCFSRVLSR